MKKQIMNIYRRGFWLAFMAALVLAGCQKNEFQSVSELDAAMNGNGRGLAIGNHSPDVVWAWNELSRKVARENAGGVAPFIEARYLAMVHIAMADALANIVPKFESYALKQKHNPFADPDAAVAQAAHDVVVALYDQLTPVPTSPALKEEVQELLHQTLEQVDNASARQAGVNIGKAAAMAILMNRMNDGSENIINTKPNGVEVGEYRYTPPFDDPASPVYGLVAAVNWGSVKPFAMTSGDQFRPGPPYGQPTLEQSVKSAQYIADYNEILQEGCSNCPARSSDRTHYAQFWVESSPQGWNKVARACMTQLKLNAWKTARVLALLNIASCDGYIASVDAKYAYDFWRPVTAIHLNNLGATPGTVGDPAWNVLVFPTPPIPDYPSGHAAEGGACGNALILGLGRDDFSFSFESSSAPPGQPSRSFQSISQAMRENSLSRIYVGYHFRHAAEVGEWQGREVGKWTVENVLKEK